MAIRSTFEAWVTEVKQTHEWGAFVTFSHQKRRKNPATDEWETVGRDYIELSVPTELLPVVQNNALVAIVANLNGTPNAYLDKNGEPKARVNGSALEIVPVERVQRGDETVEVSSQINPGLAPRAWIPNDANVAATLGAVPIQDDEAPF